MSLVSVFGHFWDGQINIYVSSSLLTLKFAKSGVNLAWNGRKENTVVGGGPQSDRTETASRKRHLLRARATFPRGDNGNVALCHGGVQLMLSYGAKDSSPLSKQERKNRFFLDFSRQASRWLIKFRVLLHWLSSGVDGEFGPPTGSEIIGKFVACAKISCPLSFSTSMEVAGLS